MGAIGEFFDYIRAPYFSEGKDRFTFDTVPVLAKLLAFKFLLIIIAVVLMSSFLGMTGTEKPAHNAKAADLIRPANMVLVALVAPFIEELFFRSWLRKRWGIKYIFPVITALSIWMLARFFQISIPGVLIWAVFGGLIGYMIWANQTWSAQDTEVIVDKVFPYAFWTTTTAFALIHLTNFNAADIGILGLIVVLPQFISGVFFGYIVKRYGFLAAVGAHGFWNGALLSASFFLGGM